MDYYKKKILELYDKKKELLERQKEIFDQSQFHRDYMKNARKDSFKIQMEIFEIEELFHVINNYDDMMDEISDMNLKVLLEALAVGGITSAGLFVSNRLFGSDFNPFMVEAGVLFFWGSYDAAVKLYNKKNYFKKIKKLDLEEKELELYDLKERQKGLDRGGCYSGEMIDELQKEDVGIQQQISTIDEQYRDVIEKREHLTDLVLEKIDIDYPSFEETGEVHFQKVK